MCTSICWLHLTPADIAMRTLRHELWRSRASGCVPRVSRIMGSEAGQVFLVMVFLCLWICFMFAISLSDSVVHTMTATVITTLGWCAFFLMYVDHCAYAWHCVHLQFPDCAHPTTKQVERFSRYCFLRKRDAAEHRQRIVELMAFIEFVLQDRHTSNRTDDRAPFPSQTPPPLPPSPPLAQALPLQEYVVILEAPGAA